MQSVQITEHVRQYIATEFLDGDEQDLEASSPLLEWGILDSVGMVKLVAYLEGEFGIRIPQSNITPTNFRDLSRISSMVETLSTRPPTAVSTDHAKADAELAELLEFGARTYTASLDSGAKLRCIEMDGPGPTWVLLPEPGEAATFFGDIQRALEGDYRSLAIDLAGFGISTGPTKDPSFWDHAGLLAELLRADEGEEYILVGHGLSAALALELAGRVRDQVSSVVALGFGDMKLAPLLGTHSDAKEHLGDRRRDVCAVPAEQLEATQHRLASPAYASFLSGDVEEQVPGLFQNATKPTLYVGALEDALVPELCVQNAAARTPGAAVKWLARSGHDFPRERADETVSMMKNFVNGLARGH